MLWAWAKYTWTVRGHRANERKYYENNSDKRFVYFQCIFDDIVDIVVGLYCSVLNNLDRFDLDACQIATV